MSRALALITQGLLDEGRMPELAARLGVGTRHLTRLFRKHCGAPPGVVARSRRVQIAKRLLDETGLSMVDVAFASGFSSLRRFNAAFRETYGRPPSALRRRRLSRTGTAAISLRLYYRPPYDWRLMLGLLSLEAVSGVECVSGTEYCRTVSVGNVAGWLAVAPADGESALSVSLHLPEYDRLGAVIDRVQTIFDLTADPNQIAGVTALCLRQGMARVRLPGLRLPGSWNGFEVAVRAVVEKDVGAERVSAVMHTLAQRLGRAVVFAARPGLTRVFPDPQCLMGATLRRCGLSARGKSALRRLARAVAQGRIRFDASMAFSALVTALVEEAGLERSAAEWIGMRTLAEPDANLASRFALRPRQRTWWHAPATRVALRPWRSYAALLLWLSNRRGVRSCTPTLS